MENTRVGMSDAHVETKAGTKKQKKDGNDIRGPNENRQWLVH